MKVLLASGHLGQRVHSFQGLELGRIVELVIDQETATLSFVALSSSPEEDPSEQLMIVPWPELSEDPDGTGLLLGINKERLKRAPALTRSELPSLGDREVRAWVLSYYGFPTSRTTTLEERRLMGSRGEGPAEALGDGERDLTRLLEAAVSGLPKEEDDEGVADMMEEPAEDDLSEAA